MLNLKEFKSVAEMKSLIKKNSNFLDGIRFAVSPFELKNYKKFIDSACINFKKLDIHLSPFSSSGKQGEGAGEGLIMSFCLKLGRAGLKKIYRMSFSNLKV